MPRIEIRAVLLWIGLLVPAAGAAGPQIQAWTTGNGARVLFVHAPELPMVDVRVVFDAGSARDAGKPGLAMLVNGLLAEGAGGMGANRIAERFAELGARFGSGSLRDMAWVSLRSVTDPALLTPAVDLVAMLLERPDFPADALERERRRALTGLQAAAQSASSVAEREFYRLVYRDHPYATLPEGTEQGLRAVTRADVELFHARYYVAANAVVAIVGAVDRARAGAIAATLTGRLPEGRPAPALPPVAPLRAPRTVRIRHPSAQSHVLVGQPGIARGDPDHIPLYVGNHALGGSGLVSLLGKVIREDRGLSYSTYSYFSPMRRAGPFTAGLQTRNDQVDEALAVLRETIASYVASGPDDRQLEASRKNITGGFPLRIDSNRKIVEYLGMIGFYGLPLDYLDTFSERVMAADRETVAAALARHLDPDNMVTVIVGGGADAGGRRAAGE